MRPLSILFVLSTALATAQSDKHDQLDQRVQAAITGFKGTVSLYAKNLDTGESYGLRENERVPTASTIKLAIMATVFDAIAHSAPSGPTKSYSTTATR